MNCKKTTLQPKSSSISEAILKALVVFGLLILQACQPSEPPPTEPPSLPTPTETQPVSADTPPPCTEIGQQWVSPLDGVTLVCVTAGEFWMGATDGDPLAQPNEKPQHQVYLDAYWIDRTEITNANFAQCVADGVCPTPLGYIRGNRSSFY